MRAISIYLQMNDKADINSAISSDFDLYQLWTCVNEKIILSTYNTGGCAEMTECKNDDRPWKTHSFYVSIMFYISVGFISVL